MTRRDGRKRRSEAGFSLIEILVATSLLVVGMTGILALFTAALTLEAEAERRTDVALALPEAMRRIDAALFTSSKSSGAAGTGGASKTTGEFDLVAAGGSYRCRYEVEGETGDGPTRAYFVRVRIVAAAGTSDEKVYDFGRVPTAPEAPPPGPVDGAQK
jgi:hypothetical protein